MVDLPLSSVRASPSSRRHPLRHRVRTQFLLRACTGECPLQLNATFLVKYTTNHPLTRAHPGVVAIAGRNCVTVDGRRSAGVGGVAQSQTADTLSRHQRGSLQVIFCVDYPPGIFFAIAWVGGRPSTIARKISQLRRPVRSAGPNHRAIRKLCLQQAFHEHIMLGFGC